MAAWCQVSPLPIRLSDDGSYRYAVSSVRIVGETQTLSLASATVSAVADSAPPNPPQGLTLAMIGSGIKATWQAPQNEVPASYRLYRAGGVEITSTTALTPIATDIKDLTCVDPRPSLTEQCYAVCAVDAAGNESGPSQSQYLNFSLLPVPNLTVTAEEGKLPVISWTSPGGNIVSFNAYVRSLDQSQEEARMVARKIMVPA